MDFRTNRLLGDPGGMGEDLARYARATTGSIRDAFAAMVAGKNLVLTIVPDGSGAPTDTDGGDPDADPDGGGQDGQDEQASDIVEIG